ncbi:hypothetical protein D3C71_593830 [compost metagenome]
MRLARGASLGEYTAQVSAHGVARNPECLGCLIEGLAVHDQHGHFGFRAGQLEQATQQVTRGLWRVGGIADEHHHCRASGAVVGLVVHGNRAQQQVQRHLTAGPRQGQDLQVVEAAGALFQHGLDGLLQCAVLMVGEGTELVVLALQTVMAVEQALGGTVAAHHPAVLVEDGRAHHQAVDGCRVELAFGIQLIHRRVQVHRLLQVRQQQADQVDLRRGERFAGVVAAGEQRAVHAGGGAHVGHQHIAQVQGVQVVAVEIMGQPGLRAQHLVGTGHLVRGPVEERADRIEVFAVRGLAGQQRAMHRGIDDQPGAFMVGVAQHQGEEAGGESLAQGFQQTGPGRGLQRAVVDQPEQVAELGRGDVDAGVQVRAGGKGQGHARLFGCVLSWASIDRGHGGKIVRLA